MPKLPSHAGPFQTRWATRLHTSPLRCPRPYTARSGDLVAGEVRRDGGWLAAADVDEHGVVASGADALRDEGMLCALGIQSSKDSDGFHGMGW